MSLLIPTAPSVVAVTLVVAASDSLDPTRADYQCTGVNDHVEIQAALDALPATGGEVKLLDGTYNVEATINLDFNQTLRGCGRNTILTTSTTNLIFLSAVGGAGTEKTGIVIADLQIDGGAGSISDCGIYFEYVDYSFIQDVYSRRHNASPGGIILCGIYLENSDFNQIVNNTCQGNGNFGIYLLVGNNNTVSGNICQGNAWSGIYFLGNLNTGSGNVCQDNDQNGISIGGNNNSIVSNICQGNGLSGIYLSNSVTNIITSNTCQENNINGIYLTFSSNNNVISSNTCQGNNDHGIRLESSDHNAIVSNTCTENSQAISNNYDDISLSLSDYNNIQGNTCRAGALDNKPRYGINISDASCDGNLVTNNNLYNDGFGTAAFNDAGTGTKLAVYVVPFSDGSDYQDSGFLIDADTEYARAWLRLPPEVQQVVRIKIYARAVAASGTTMALEINVNGGADNEAFNTHATAAPNTPSTSTNFAADDVIYWTLTSAEIVALVGGDSIEIKVLHEAANAGGVTTDAYLRTVEIEYQ